MKKVAVFPGSFDPFTVGHESIVRRALPMFDEIIIAVGANALKKSFYTVETRKDMISKIFAGESRIRVDHYEGLTVDYCMNHGAGYILRGLRTAADFEFERAIAQVNKAMAPSIESVFILTVPEHSYINSTIVRDIIRSGGDASKFVPGSINLKDFKGDEEL
ncbi:MAG TPA: pantetheine-phosphate adenylyltransferase [Bacteroidales bacterium]|nr:pantetheine-phosphate adenylyltransferase [Bacteroidales bacterium]